MTIEEVKDLSDGLIKGELNIGFYHNQLKYVYSYDEIVNSSRYGCINCIYIVEDFNHNRDDLVYLIEDDNLRDLSVFYGLLSISFMNSNFYNSESTNCSEYKYYRNLYPFFAKVVDSLPLYQPERFVFFPSFHDEVRINYMFRFTHNICYLKRNSQFCSIIINPKITDRRSRYSVLRGQIDPLSELEYDLNTFYKILAFVSNLKKENDMWLVDVKLSDLEEVFKADEQVLLMFFTQYMNKEWTKSMLKTVVCKNFSVDGTNWELKAS